MTLKPYIYEYPYSEKLRLILRLESIFSQIDTFLSYDNIEFSKYALSHILDLVTITMRHELKSDLLQEINKISYSYAENTSTSEALKEFSEYSQRLHNLNTIHLDQVRNNEFLNVLKQRLSIIGGTCSFDLPLLGNWLRLPHTERNAHINEWLAPFKIFEEGILMLLQFIRSNMTLLEIEPNQGFHSQAFPKQTAFIRIDMSDFPTVFPEISGNYHRTNIHLLTQEHPNARPKNFIDAIKLKVYYSAY